MLRDIKTVPNFIYGKQLLTELYETFYEIRNHVTSTDPLSLVLVNEAETFEKNSKYELYFNTFILQEVHKKTGLNFDEFIARPKVQIDRILRLIEVYDARKLKAGQNALEKMEAANKKAAGQNLDDLLE